MESYRVTAVNDWHKLVLKHQEYYLSRKRRRIKWIISGVVAGVIVERIVSQNRRKNRG